MRGRTVVLKILVLWAALVPCVVRGAGLPAAVVRDIEQVIASEMAEQKIPGLSVAIAVDHQLTWSAGFGMSDLENRVPAKPSTAYRLASISKPITAVAAMQLAERRKLDLDAPVQKYVPAFPEKAWPVTPRLLLSHLSGIRHYNGPEELNSTRHYATLSDALNLFAPDPLAFESGTSYGYTTYGYVLLGVVIERAADTRFMDYLRENIFRPAEMETIHADSVYEIIPNRARGYRKTRAGQIQNCSLADTSNKIPGGGLISTAGDLVKFALAVDRGGLLSKESVQQMFTPQRLRDGKALPYGLGWHIMDENGLKWVGHGGGQQGTSTYLLLLPGQGLSVAVMENLEGTNLRNSRRA